MIIRLDYDNNQVLVGSERDFNDPDLGSAVDFSIRDMKQINSLLQYIFNMQLERGDNLNIELQKQSDGQITTIEEY